MNEYKMIGENAAGVYKNEDIKGCESPSFTITENVSE